MVEGQPRPVEFIKQQAQGIALNVRYRFKAANRCSCRFPAIRPGREILAWNSSVQKKGAPQCALFAYLLKTIR
jgi:hypothetical protein